MFHLLAVVILAGIANAWSINGHLFGKCFETNQILTDLTYLLLYSC